MAFKKLGWSTIQNLGSPDAMAGTRRNMHSYVTNDALATVAADDHFLEVAAQIKVGDVIMVCADLDGTPVGKHYIVDAATTATVTVAVFS